MANLFSVFLYLCLLFFHSLSPLLSHSLSHASHSSSSIFFFHTCNLSYTFKVVISRSFKDCKHIALGETQKPCWVICSITHQFSLLEEPRSSDSTPHSLMFIATERQLKTLNLPRTIFSEAVLKNFSSFICFPLLHLHAFKDMFLLLPVQFSSMNLLWAPYAAQM